MNAKLQKKKYHDIKKVFGKEYFKSYFIKPKVHLSLSPSSTKFQSDIKKNDIISTKNSSNNLSSKIKDAQVIKISKNKSNINYFKLVKEDKKHLKKTKILIKSLINQSNNNFKKHNDSNVNVYNNYLSISNRRKNLIKKNNEENYINEFSNNSNISNTDYIYNNIINKINEKQNDINSKKNQIIKKNNKKKVCDAISNIKIDRDNKIKLKNVKNFNKIKLKSKNSKNLLQLKLNDINNIEKRNSKINTKELFDNSKPNLNTIESNSILKKIKINNILNNKKINKNKSCDTFNNQNNKKCIKSSTSKNKKNNVILKKNVKYIIFNTKSNSHSLYTKIFPQNKNTVLPRFTTETNEKIKNNNTIRSKKSNIKNYCFKNKSIDVNNSNNSFKIKFFAILKEERKKIREKEFQKNMEEIKRNSNMRRHRYIQLFNEINKSFEDIKKIIEQIEKEDLLKDITSKIQDESILNNENSISLEQKLKTILNNRLFNKKNGKNNSISEGTTSVIYNDFTFEEDKEDIMLKSIDIKKNSIFENNKSSFTKTNDKENCFIF